MLAAKYSNTDSNVETVRLLIEAGANVNEKDNEGWKALSHASKYVHSTSNMETVALLEAAHKMK